MHFTESPSFTVKYLLSESTRSSADVLNVYILLIRVSLLLRFVQEMEIDDAMMNGGGPTPGHPRITREVLSGLAPPPRPDPTDNVRVTMGSADWHSAVPQDWVPVIHRDVDRQRRTGAQPPFSDAYLNGMPAKRRKVSFNSC